MNKLMTRSALAAIALIASVTLACSQSDPGLIYGQVPTAAQWNSYFAAKQNYPVPVFTTTTNGIVPAPGTSVGNCLKDDATWGTCSGGGGGGSPGGSNGQVQYNNSGAFGGISSAVFSAGILTLTSPVLVTPDLGTPSALILTNATGLAPSTGLSAAVPVAKGGTNCTSAALACLTAITGATGSPSSSTFLRGDNTWATPAGSGNVSGPGSSVAGNVVSFNGTSGTIIQDSGVAASALATLTGSQTLTNKAMNGASNTFSNIGNSSLSNSTITIGSSSVSLGATISTINGALTLTGANAYGVPASITLTNATGLPPSTGLSAAVPVNKGGTNCTAAAIGCVTAISGATGTPSSGTYLRGDGTWSTPAGGISLSAANVWTGQQSTFVTALTVSGSTFTPTGASNDYSMTLNCTPCTIANPSSTPVAGTSGTMILTQDGTGSRTVTWGSQYIAQGGVSSITLSTGAGQIDHIGYRVVDATHILISPIALNPTH